MTGSHVVPNHPGQLSLPSPWGR